MESKLDRLSRRRITFGEFKEVAYLGDQHQLLDPVTRKVIGDGWMLRSEHLPTDEQLAATHAGWKPPEIVYLRPKNYKPRNGKWSPGFGCWQKRRYSLTEKGKSYP